MFIQHINRRIPFSMLSCMQEVMQWEQNTLKTHTELKSAETEHTLQLTKIWCCKHRNQSKRTSQRKLNHLFQVIMRRIIILIA